MEEWRGVEEEWYPKPIELVIRDLVPSLGGEWVQISFFGKRNQVVAHGLRRPVPFRLRREVLNLCVC